MHKSKNIFEHHGRLSRTSAVVGFYLSIALNINAGPETYHNRVHKLVLIFAPRRIHTGAVRLNVMTRFAFGAVSLTYRRVQHKKFMVFVYVIIQHSCLLHWFRWMRITTGKWNSRRLLLVFDRQTVEVQPNKMYRTTLSLIHVSLERSNTNYKAVLSCLDTLPLKAKVDRNSITRMKQMQLCEDSCAWLVRHIWVTRIAQKKNNNNDRCECRTGLSFAQYKQHWIHSQTATSTVTNKKEYPLTYPGKPDKGHIVVEKEILKQLRTHF